MSVDFKKKHLQENLKRQSKRFAKLVGVPLNKAQYLLAVHVYSESSFADIKNKIDKGDMSGRLHLAAVAPDASQHVLDVFAKDFGDLYVSLQESPISELYSGTMRDFIFGLFDLKSDNI